MKLSLLCVCLLPICAALAYTSSNEFIAPGDIQADAYSLQSATVPLQLNPATISDVKKLDDGGYRITFTDPDNYKSIFARVSARLLPLVKSSSVLYVRVVTPGRNQSEIEILGNSMVHDNRYHPAERIVWADY